MFSQTFTHGHRKTDEDSKKRGVSTESKAGTKGRCPDGLSPPDQNTILINTINMVLFYKIRKRYNEIQLTKNKMDLNNRKMTHRPPSPSFL